MKFIFKSPHFQIFKLTLILIPLISPAQNWPKQYYTTTSNTWVKEIVECYDKGFAFVSQVGDGPGMYGWIIKTDINGEKLWDKHIYSPEYRVGPNGMDKTSDGGFIQIGSTTKLDPEDYDFYVAKFNACGNKEWCSIFPTPGNSEYGVQIRQVPDGYISMVSYFRDWVNKRIWLVKLDNDGNEIWEKYYTSTDTNIWSEECRHLLVASNGDYIISGYGYYPMPDGYYRLKPLMIRTDTAGNDQWYLIYGAGGDYVGPLWSDIAENNAGFLYDGTGRQTDSTELPAFIKVSPQGNEVYSVDLMTGTASGGVSTLNLLNNDTLILGYATRDFADSSQIGFLKCDTLGNVTKAKVLLENIWRGFVSSKITFDEKVVTVGTFNENQPTCRVYLYKLNRNLEYDSIYTGSYTYDSLCPHAVVSDTTNLDDCNIITSVSEKTSPEQFRLTAFPNPCSDKITIILPEKIETTVTSGTRSVSTVYHKWKGAVLEVYNQEGKKVYSQPVSGETKTLTIDVSGWNKGVYAARLVFRGKGVGMVKILKNS